MLLWSFVALARLRRQYDVVFVSGFKALGVSAVLTSRLFGKTCVLKADSNGEMSGAFFAGGLRRMRLTAAAPAFRAFLAVRNGILRRADRFVAITAEIAQELEACGVSADRILAITNSVDTTRFHPVSDDARRALRVRLGLTSKDIILIYTGRLVTYKGVPLLVSVAGRIGREQGNVALVLLGSGGLDMHNCEADVREYVRARGLEDVVLFAGEVSNVHEYLQASDVFVLPTAEDAFPLALIEAMACGLPVVSTPVGGIGDVVTSGQNGLLVPAGSAGELYEALQRVIGSTSLSASLGAAAMRTVRGRYSREIIADRYVELFRCLSAPRGAPCTG
jgi:glycosyltransferase involved in cell wall biosynthesis